MKLCGIIWHSQRGHNINIIWRMRTTCLVTTDTYSEYVILVVFRCTNDYENASQCSVIRTLPVLLKLFLRLLLFIRKLLYSVTNTMLAP